MSTINDIRMVWNSFDLHNIMMTNIILTNIISYDQGASADSNGKIKSLMQWVYTMLSNSSNIDHDN